MSQQDELSKFKKIISKLPEEKRKFLYKRLQSLPPDERENYIAEFNKKYEVYLTYNTTNVKLQVNNINKNLE